MPSDLAHFRELTMSTPMIMGRRTYASIGKPLPGRETIVVTRDRNLEVPANVHRVADPDAAMALAEARASVLSAPSISLIGGATLFETLINRADRLALTLIDLAPPADTFFPKIDWTVWREALRVEAPADARDEANCVFVTYERIG